MGLRLVHFRDNGASRVRVLQLDPGGEGEFGSVVDAGKGVRIESTSPVEFQCMSEFRLLAPDDRSGTLSVTVAHLVEEDATSDVIEGEKVPDRLHLRLDVRHRVICSVRNFTSLQCLVPKRERLLFSLLEFFLNLSKPDLLQLSDHLGDRRLIPLSGLHAGIGGVIEIGVELEILFVGNRIVLVVVALGALHREPEPDVGRGFDPVRDIADAELFSDRAAFIGAGVIAVES